MMSTKTYLGFTAPSEYNKLRMLDDYRDIDDCFLTRTYNMVDNHIMDSIASWSQSGKSFIIWNPKKFTALVLFYYRFENLLPLILSGYGFKRVGFERHEYANDNFVRGHHRLMKNIPTPNLFTTQESIMNRIGRLTKERNELIGELHKQEIQIKELKHRLQHQGVCKL
ncbi:hypothetical protein CARUB_v10007768mg [Capsella rubella]|uniref:HSF-type DNA-binding domain-containing protein n=1 Tax=Capsella rubella TaxID=81985 RepID=R0H360_9BRAS|nr:hypothetical protein CARUB_v10007768mg [Capsella rubella]